MIALTVTREQLQVSEKNLKTKKKNPARTKESLTYLKRRKNTERQGHAAVRPLDLNPTVANGNESEGRGYLLSFRRSLITYPGSREPSEIEPGCFMETFPRRDSSTPSLRVEERKKKEAKKKNPKCTEMFFKVKKRTEIRAGK